MKKLALLVALVLAFSFTALAQAASASGTQETQTTTTTKKAKKGGEGAAGETAGAAKEQQLTGCLEKSPEGNGFVLINGRHKKGVAVTSAEDISAHVGHEVRLMGTWEKPMTGGAGAKGEEMHTFKATSLKHLSDTCAAGEKAPKKGGKTAGATKS